MIKCVNQGWLAEFIFLCKLLSPVHTSGLWLAGMAEWRMSANTDRRALVRWTLTLIMDGAYRLIQRIVKTVLSILWALALIIIISIDMYGTLFKKWSVCQVQCSSTYCLTETPLLLREVNWSLEAQTPITTLATSHISVLIARHTGSLRWMGKLTVPIIFLTSYTSPLMFMAFSFYFFLQVCLQIHLILN